MLNQLNVCTVIQRSGIRQEIKGKEQKRSIVENAHNWSFQLAVMNVYLIKCVCNRIRYFRWRFRSYNKQIIKVLYTHLLCVCMHTHLPALSMWSKGTHTHTHTLRHMWWHTKVPFGQIGVLFCHSSPESHFRSVQSLWSEGFLPAVLPEVKVIRLGMRAGLLGLPFLLFSPSPLFMSPNPNCLFKSKNIPSPSAQVTSDIFLHCVLLTFSLTPFFWYISPSEINNVVQPVAKV